MGRASSEQILGEKGPFATRVEEFRVREGQQRVAAAVERVLLHDGALICEAGTGIGKTFAYLVPAIQSGRKVIISTATKTLQNQIAYRDLPLVQSVLGTDVPVSVMKGLSNYLCRRRYREFLLSEEALRPAYAQPISALQSFLKLTELGDFSELTQLSEGAPVLGHVASSSETRVGPNCPYFDECFVTSMKRDAEAAQIVVVNHHLFFADLALRGPHPGHVLPDYDAVIFDEAHQIEDIAALFFGLRVTRSQFERLEKEGDRLFLRAKKLLLQHQTPVLPLARGLRDAVGAFFDPLCAGVAGRLIVKPRELEKKWGSQLATLSRALEDVQASALGLAAQVAQGGRVAAAEGLSEGLEQLARRAEALVSGLKEMVAEQSGRVVWLEVSADQTALSSTPVDLSSILHDRLFQAVPAVALLSATLSTRGSDEQGRDTEGLSFVRSRWGATGLADLEQLCEPSPFSYAKQCALYVPDDLPQPRSDTFLESAATRIAQLLEMIPGGAFVLTTSLVSMRKLHGLLREKGTRRLLLMQGDRPKGALLSAFRHNGQAILVATSSFWEGIDVPGDALQLVILEKLPFAVPTDPVFAARSEAIAAAGLSPFRQLALPFAALSLKQGFGRLIRRETDRGVVALLDERVLTKGYGKRILAALPAARRCSDLEEVGDFVSSWPS